MEEKRSKTRRVYVPREKIQKITELILDVSLKKAYLDIETDENFVPTLVGIYVKDSGFKSLVRPNIKADEICRVLEGAEVVVTYNGERFDLEVLERASGFKLPANVQSLDLMYLCWELDLYGGLKKVERELGIVRDKLIEGMNGLDAVKLWNDYESGDRHALSLLRLYNYYDVMNLVELENRLRKRIVEERQKENPRLNLF